MSLAEKPGDVIYHAAKYLHRDDRLDKDCSDILGNAMKSSSNLFAEPTRNPKPDPLAQEGNK